MEYNVSQAELRKPRIQKNETAVRTALLESWVNPFAASQELLSVSTARADPKHITKNLVRAPEVGEGGYVTFVAERLESDIQPFHD